jgi:hypothetical protein
MVAELDCESPESAISSLAALTGVSSESILERCRKWRFHNFKRFGLRRGINGFDVAREELWRRVIQSETRPLPTSVCWFHASRVLPSTDFSEGLLPLNRMVDRLTESIEKAGIRRSRDHEGRYVSSHEHEQKIEHGSQSWGPDASLVKDATFDPAQNHFFRAPEAVVDLGFDLDAFIAVTVPCIVKFRSSADISEHLVDHALYYAYLSTWGQRAGIDCSWAWSGEGNLVPAEDILSVEFLDANDRRTSERWLDDEQ